jgi:nicotinamidase-related amidase
MAGAVYGSGRAAGSTAAARAPAAAAGHDTALLLIDFQRGFITGTWAEEQGLSPFLPRPPPARPLARFPLTLTFSLSGGAEEVLPIADAAARLADLYATSALSSLPSLATRFFLQSPDSLPPANLAAALSEIPWVSKQGSNVMESAAFAAWLEARIAEGVTTLVVRTPAKRSSFSLCAELASGPFVF